MKAPFVCSSGFVSSTFHSLGRSWCWAHAQSQSPLLRYGCWAKGTKHSRGCEAWEWACSDVETEHELVLPGSEHLYFSEGLKRSLLADWLHLLKSEGEGIEAPFCIVQGAAGTPDTPDRGRWSGVHSVNFQGTRSWNPASHLVSWSQINRTESGPHSSQVCQVAGTVSHNLPSQLSKSSGMKQGKYLAWHLAHSRPWFP